MKGEKLERGDADLVSVIVPVYNIREYVRDCLESVCGQSYRNLEIIVVDDGSTDGSGEICDEFASRDERVKVHHKKNGGLSDARNYGISKARGEFMVLVDGDDEVKKDYVAEMMRAVDAKVDMVVCGYNDEVPEGMTMSGETAAARLLVGQENIDMVAWNKLYRRGLFDGIRYPEGEKHEDALTTYKLMAKAREVKYVAKSLYVYKVRDGSIMDTVSVLSRLMIREKAAKEAVEYFADNAQLKQAAEVAVLTAKYAFVDAAVRGAIEKKYYEKNRQWILAHRGEYAGNIYMTRKLKMYNLMIGGFWYKIFRKIRHE